MANKRQKLDPHIDKILDLCPINKIQKILAAAAEADDDAVNPKTWVWKEAFAAPFEAVEATIPLTMEDGTSWDWPLCDPNKLMQKLVAESAGMAALFASAAAASPPSAEKPWRMVVGFDEFVPGNKLKIDNRRKAMVLNFSFLELGENLRLEACWFTPIVVRANIMGKVQGGWSAMLKQYLHLHLFGLGGLCNGVRLCNGVVVFGCLHNVLSDGDGIRMGLSWLGGNAMKPCFRHSNVLAKRNATLAQEDRQQPGRLAMVDITCADSRLMQTAVPGCLEAAMDLAIAVADTHAAGGLSDNRCKEILKCNGMKPNRHGVLADTALREHVDWASVCTFDWVHCALQDGSLTVECYRFIEAAEGLGLTSFPDIENYLKTTGWNWPHSSKPASSLHRIFDSYRSDSSKTNQRLKTSASEMISLYSLLRHYVETKIGRHAGLESKRRSFDACCLVIDMLLDAKRGVVSLRTAAPALQGALANHMQKHLAAYGDKFIKPKHHWMFDIAEQLKRDPILLDAFVVERLHLRAKAAAERVDNTRTFEKSTISLLMRAHQRQLEDIRGDGLRNSMALPGASGIQVADHLKVGGVAVSVGDFVVHAGAVCEVVACLAEDDDFFVVGKPTERIAQTSPSSARHRFTGGRTILVNAVHLEQTIAWHVSGDEVTILFK